MTPARPGMPGHDNSAAFVRLRREKLADDPPGHRPQDTTADGPYEIICPGCGDDTSRNWSEISEESGPDPGHLRPKESADAALMAVAWDGRAVQLGS